jgi:hypothetical protein
MPKKFGCPTPFSAMRRRDDSTTFWCPMSTFVSSLRAMFSTVSGIVIFLVYILIFPEGNVLYSIRYLS